MNEEELQLIAKSMLQEPESDIHAALELFAIDPEAAYKKYPHLKKRFDSLSIIAPEL
ncbi:MAG: hypothetical protein LH473_01270 [Chitinophagales bacterium]|nr:hypothetical protein [Chitinophagales bacterium]